MGRLFITGDVHGNFRRMNEIKRFCKYNTTKDDVMVLLGDVGANYFFNERDRQFKELMASCPITFICVHGNHEERPENISSYTTINYGGARCYIEYDYPNILFPKNGKIYLNNYKCLIIGGAYSVDKKYRLATGKKWFKSEQLSDKEKIDLNYLIKGDNSYDYIFTHTAPLTYEPKYLFLKGIDQLAVDKSMENFLQWIWDNIDLNRLKYWLFGHYHSDVLLDEKVRLLYYDIIEIL